MLRLARRAMTQLAIQRRFPAQLILDLAAMAAGLVPRLELLRVVHAVRRTELPLIFLWSILLRLLKLVRHGG